VITNTGLRTFYFASFLNKTAKPQLTIATNIDKSAKPEYAGIIQVFALTGYKKRRKFNPNFIVIFYFPIIFDDSHNECNFLSQ
jgi:hypothetical protein